MKRPPGLWLLLSAGVLWLCFQDVSCVRATKLIFGKSTTSTTSTTTVAPEEAGEEEEVATEVVPEVKSNFTGVPQMDYIYDPNLPRELNGANLTDYPFYSLVPEVINFKCDGLHDGFYASIEHKCQVYHHCIYGTRHDFLCANYTAFDQKTFICQFVSEVDCVNSKKFWHRNDALYEPTTTTTIKSTFVYTPPEPSSILSGGRRPSQSQPAGSQNRRRKPTRRRRPQYDYYDEYEEDDYYEEPRYTATEATRTSGRRKRPRPRPRPIYDDEYEEYEDEHYDRRKNTGRRGEEERRTYDRDRRGRPPARRNKDERKKQEDYMEEDDDPRFDKTEARKRPTNKRREDDMQEDRPKNRPEEAQKKRKEEDAEEDRPSNKKRRQEEVPEERPKSRKNQRRPIVEEYYDEEETRPVKKVKDEESLDERKDRRPINKNEDDSTLLVQSQGTSIYDRPRTAPKIRPPVPKGEANKYSYKGVKTTQKPSEEEYYDEYEDEVKSVKSDSTPSSSTESKNTRKDNNEQNRSTYRAPQKNSRPRPSGRKPARDDYEEYEEERPRRPIKDRRVEPKSKPIYDEYEDISVEAKSSTTKSAAKDRNIYYREERSTTTTTSTTTEAPVKDDNTKMNFRVVKRPFLPSRGGNPYSPRGLQPLGLQAIEETRKEVPQIQNESTSEADPPPPPRKQNKYIPIKEDYQRNNKEQPFLVKSVKNVETNTPKSKVYEKNPLDLIENDYDVTLNDALNPTLPNLPLRSFPTGFSASNDYTYTYQRPRYVDASLNQASSEYNYRFKIPQNSQGLQSPHVLQGQPGVLQSQQSLQVQVFEPQTINRSPSQNYQNFRASPRAPQTYYATF